MTDPSPRNLSVHLAFVVQFATETQVEAGRIVGRAEHVMSGRAADFESWDALQAFISRVLEEVHEPPSEPTRHP